MIFAPIFGTIFVLLVVLVLALLHLSKCNVSLRQNYRVSLSGGFALIGVLLSGMASMICLLWGI